MAKKVNYENLERSNYGPFADYIRSLREEYGYTQKYIAELLDMSPAAYGYYERGERCPTPSMIVSLAVLYRVSIDCMLRYAIRSERSSLLDQFVKESDPYGSESKSQPTFANPHQMIVSDKERKMILSYREQSTDVQNFIERSLRVHRK